LGLLKDEHVTAHANLIISQKEESHLRHVS